MLCSDWPSVVGAPASDPEDGLSGSDHTETGRDTGSVDRTEPDGHHDPHCAHPDHRTAGSCKSHDIKRHYSTLTTMIDCQKYRYLKEASIIFFYFLFNINLKVLLYLIHCHKKILLNNGLFSLFIVIFVSIIILILSCIEVNSVDRY